ncbi:hypothetical protein [uncultured Veillonella sp.]|uniref:hypothetical protein n=1 Tax=uncultured Veillonella sp. TaxID=159268 RepID=UPI0025CBF6A9|nr:hypothetical protein [uncultured Veillonella sp.]
MTSILKKSFLMALACICIGTYGVVKGQDAMDAQTKVSGPLEMSVEAAVPGVVMPSPVHVFTTVEAASEYIGFRPQMPKLLPVGFNIQSVITLEKDILQVVYVYKSGTEPYYNQDGGAYIIYRSSKLTGDISGDHKIYKVIETERVDGTKVTFKGGKKMVYLASWMKDGQNHSLEFQRPVTRDMAKAMIRNIVEEKAHTK